jgi:hypothetical protein
VDPARARQGLTQRIGPVLLDREAESQHAASLGSARDGSLVG